MGWKCNQCGNTELFVEINRVESTVTQEKNSAHITKIINRYIENPLDSVRCAKCNNQDLQWLRERHDAKNSIEQSGYVAESHSIATIELELTNKCNLDCAYCTKSGDSEIDIEVIRNLLEQNSLIANPISNFELGWDSGNPLLHSHIREIILLFRQYGYFLNIVTNGKDFLSLTKALPLNNRVTFALFLDNPNAEANDELMGAGTFDDTIAACRFLRQGRQQFDIYMRLSKGNYDKVSEMKKLADSMGAGALVPVEIFPLGKATDSITMEDAMKQKVLEDLFNIGLKKSIHYSPALPNTNCSYLRCQRLFINSKAELSFCHFLQSLENSCIEDIRGKHILEIIHSNSKIRAGFLRNKARDFSKWAKPRQEASPCSYCLHAFGIQRSW
jgi:MoaA/NifB/PqqE/SkfB family radical SAM enzyme